MDTTLIENWNNTVRQDDIVYHLGDFGYLNSTTYAKYLNELNGHIVLFRGNHDDKNKIKTYLDKAMMSFGGKIVFAQHHPPEIIPKCDMVIIGHVHEKYLFKINKNNPNIPIINVGIDVNDYKPISVDTLLKLYNKIKYFMKINKNIYGQFSRNDIGRKFA